MALGRRLAVAVANDSGAGHLLAASGVAMISLFGPSAAAKFAPAARRLTLIEAQRFGGSEMSAIPLAAVSEAVEVSLAPTPPPSPGPLGAAP
jgi:ADP-heptose:LPS heptosyltransferase